MNKTQPRYSGPNRSGICRCGHSWDEHHLGIVLNEHYYAETHEGYAPQECEHYGANELGGMMPSKTGWVEHCRNYVDSKEDDK